VVRDLVLIKVGGREPQVHGGKLRVGGLQLDHRGFGFRRQIVTDLRYLGLDLGQRGVGVIVELQVNRDGAQALRARRLHVIDAVSAGNHTLQGRSNEPANQISVRPYVRSRDLHHSDVAAGILPHAEGANRLQAGNQDCQIDADGKYWSFDKEIRELHLIVLEPGSR